MRILLLLLISISGFAQTEVRLQILDSIGAPPELFLAGDFNGWQAGDEKYHFVNQRLIIDSLPDIIEFKVVGKSWAEVEATKEGKPIPNRKRIIRPGATIDLEILGWEKPPKQEPLAENIHSHLNEKDLVYRGQSKALWVYLPASYKLESKKVYPVLYLMDGQNLFLSLEGSAVKWQVGKSLDSLKLDFIVVGIEHGGVERINELSPYPNPKYGGGEADSLLIFIQKPVQAFLRKRYRISEKREQNFIGGSSLGGLFAMNAVLKANENFGGALVFSPSYWFNPELALYASRYSQKKRTFVYQLMGGQEGSDPAKNIALVKDMATILEASEQPWVCKTKIVAKGQHSESFWQQEFPEAILWLNSKMLENEGEE
ncbi:MAG: hypothetical protein DA405_11380 [Bacteroidetes bacterium]|nr:MAG: hypothetical protein DA405_11380 [Bacteroidota bacterium]